MRGPAKVFTTEAAAIHAIKTSQIVENDVMVLTCCGPAGACAAAGAASVALSRRMRSGNRRTEFTLS